MSFFLVGLLVEIIICLHFFLTKYSREKKNWSLPPPLPTGHPGSHLVSLQGLPLRTPFSILLVSSLEEENSNLWMISLALPVLLPNLLLLNFNCFEQNISSSTLIKCRKHWWPAAQGIGLILTLTEQFVSSMFIILQKGHIRQGNWNVQCCHLSLFCLDYVQPKAQLQNTPGPQRFESYKWRKSQFQTGPTWNKGN